MEKALDVDAWVSSINELTETIENLLQYGKQAAQESPEEFIRSKISKLFSVVPAYKACFERLDVMTRNDFDKKIHQNSQHVPLRFACFELMDAEEHWDSFLKNLDNKLEVDNSNTVKLGETGPVHVPVVDAHSSERKYLRDLLTEKKSVIIILIRHFA